MNNDEFKAEIQPHYKLMYRVAASVLRNDDEAADAVHDAVLKIFERRNQLKDVPNVKQFCLSVVRNTCLNIIRDRKASIEIDKVTDLNLNENEDVYNIIEFKDLSDYVAKLIERLPVDQKRVFQLSAFGGFSNAEIAELLGITQGNVRVILSRARKKIKVLFSK
ncbi:RNA polymerase sigma factor [uncultured Duncaniella sp.]|jgi:RNA polymerase sigma-70 factor (ECF subfamily)|uniref:RNA polymerase sigma factor n=1 Tax=uncultured Duncaniella sp. TaxID=2768039 RepID=UPI0026770051|nr:sigma-70 family RNA polymerase sigma factor [uncultured Duncaniella sp.]